MNIVSVLVDNNQVGISWFCEDQLRISCGQVYVIPKNLEEVTRVVSQIKDIRVILIPTNSTIDLCETLQKWSETGKIQKVSIAEYSYDNAISKLLDIEIETTPTLHQRDNNLKYEKLNSIIDLDKTAMVKSLGGLLCYLNNNQLIDRQFSILSLQFEHNFMQTVYFNHSVLDYLSIFKDEIHPSMIKGKGKPKEGYSLFMLFSKYIHTKLGQNKLRHLFLTPTFDTNLLYVIIHSILFYQQMPYIHIHAGYHLDYLILPKFQKYLQNLQQNDVFTLRRQLNPIQIIEKERFNRILLWNDIGENKKCCSLRGILRKLVDVSMSFDDWHRFKITLENTLNIMRMFLDEKGQGTESLIFIKYLQQDSYEQLSNLNQLLDEYLTFSITEGELSIQSGIISELDELIKVYESLDEILDYHSEQELIRLANTNNFTSQIIVQYFPQLGFYIAIQKGTSIPSPNSAQQLFSNCSQDEYKSVQLDLDHQQVRIQYGLPDDYEPCFEVQDALLFKNSLCKHLDESYGDIQSKIMDIQRDVLREIESQIIDCSEVIIGANEFISDVDLYFCLFESSQVYGLRRAELVEESTLIIYETHNILTEIAVGEKCFIPNNFCVKNFTDQSDQSILSRKLLNPNFSNRFTFLTGPNYSGKSVLLKTIGMVYYLAMIGSFVPCRFARIGMIDAIYTTSGNHDSVLKVHGQTMREQSTLNFILQQASNKSLILLDEFGKSHILIHYNQQRL